jgi:protein ImuB
MEKRPKKRFVCVWFPWLVSERLARKEPALARHVTAAIEEDRGRLTVAAVNRRAWHGGLKPGMALADARAVQPGLETRFVNRAADRASLMRLANWATRYTPWAAPAEGHSLFLDISGCAHLFDGEEALAADLAQRLSALGLTPLVAVADTPGAAWALSRERQADVAILPSFGTLSEGMAALKDFTLPCLRLPVGVMDSLAGFGLRTVGALYPLERRALTERFGPLPVQRLDQALGVADEPISPLMPVPPHEARQAFAEPIATRDAIDEALRSLLDRLCASLAETGEGVRQLSLAWHRVDGTVSRLRLGTSRPARWPMPLFRLFTERLEEVDPGFGIEVMSLAATRVEKLPAAQADWRARDGGGAALPELLDRLGNRFGFHHIARPGPRQSWIPERAVEEAAPFAAQGGGDWPAGRERPLRLLVPPEPVDAMAPVPDDPPVLFRRRGKAYRVRTADGPERLEGEWWQRNEPARDYYLVEDEAGQRYWLYRQGLYEAGAEPRWFLHGVFA